jgi:MFS family permease
MGEVDDREARKIGRRMAIIAFMAQNAASGLSFGVFGTMLVPLEQYFHVDRSISALGMPLLLMALALGAPIIGGIVHRIGTRKLMVAGAALGALGYGSLMVAPNIYVVLAAYALLIGPGYALLGAMLPSSLVSHWYAAGRGRVLGLINIPALLALVPLGATRLLEWGGLKLVYGSAALFMAILILPLLMIIDRPEERGLRPIGGAPQSHAEAPALPVAYATLAARPVLWLVLLIGCLLGSTGAAMSTHIVAYGISRGFDPLAAAAFLTVLGLSGVIGAPLFGWLADRFGGIGALMMDGGLQALLFAGLLFEPSYAVVLAIACGFGVASNGMVSAFYATLSERFGAQNFSRVYGLFGIANLVFVVGAPTMAGVIYTRTGNYQLPFAIMLGSSCLAIMVGLLVRANDGRTRVCKLEAGV